MLKWPDKPAVDAAVRRWARTIGPSRPEVARIGYFGSYARGDWGVGSDVDLIILLDHADEAFQQRSLNWDLSALPVPAEVVVYTAAEWTSSALSARFRATIEKETVWVYERESGGQT